MCADCLGVNSTKTISRLSKLPCAPVTRSLGHPKLLLALVASAVSQVTLVPKNFDKLCKIADELLALVGLCLAPAREDMMPLVPHLHKLSNRYTAPETYMAYHQVRRQHPRRARQLSHPFAGRRAQKD